ncbi:TPA: hypothetical protein ACH2M9_001802 [Streptococcus pyogenes]|nr:hypothetical protein ER616_09720 [Streptococcus pyogenes]HEQ1315678.1 hypothetical protein [Streptococcus pyogenes]
MESYLKLLIIFVYMISMESNLNNISITMINSIMAFMNNPIIIQLGKHIGCIATNVTKRRLNIKVLKEIEMSFCHRDSYPLVL